MWRLKGALTMKELLYIVVIVGGWLLLQAYILPKFGVKTWIVPQRQVVEKKVEEGKIKSPIENVK